MNIIFKKNNTLSKIIYINVLLFIITQLYIAYNRLNNNLSNEKIYDFFGASSSLKELIYEPWTIMTHMFTHIEYLHFFINMFFLYFFGKIFLIFIEEQKIILFYIFGGLSGLFFFLITSNLLEALNQNTLCGASAAIFSIMSASAILEPKYKISIPIIRKIKLFNLVFLYVIFDIIILQVSNNPGGHVAHLGGVFFGVIYSILIKDKNNKIKITRDMSDDEWRENKKNKEEKINQILDKISKSGFDSLTNNEKKFLEKEK